jgi:RNA recognition motif-containing protein
MASKLFIGSLAWATTDDSLRDLFATVGNVVSANVIMDRETNRSKGFGFVEMGSDEEAKKAVEELNGKDLDGRAIVVSEARPREERPRRDFGGGGGGGDRY